MTLEAVSAEKPCGDSRSVTRVPSVLITRQPPENVPAAITAAQTIFTQIGTRCVGTEAPAGDQASDDHAHRLLRVVRAVRERDERCSSRSDRARKPRCDVSSRRLFA